MIENLILKPLANIAAQPWQVIVAVLVFFIAFSFVFYIFVTTFQGIGRLIGRCLTKRGTTMKREMTLLEAYSELPFEARKYFCMARMIDAEKTDKDVRELAESIRKTKELMREKS